MGWRRVPRPHLWSKLITVRLSPTPQLSASAASPTAANLSWGAIAQASGYRVFQINGQQSTLLTSLDSSTTAYQVTGLTPASTASFIVEAYHGSIVAASSTAG